MSWSPSIPALRVFVKIATVSSFTDAARALNVSQPALSRTVRLLEDQFGTRLFDRDTRHVRLTSAGEALLPVVTKLIADFDGAFSELSLTFGGKRGRVVVGALPSLAASMLPRAIAEFRKTHPEIEVIVHDTMSRTIERQFVDREIDLGLIAQSQNVEGLNFTVLGVEEFGLAFRESDETMQSARRDWGVFAEHPFIAMSSLSSVRRATDFGMIQAGIEVRPLFECAHLATLGGLIEAGLGISAVPRSLVPLLSSRQIAWSPLSGAKVTRTIGVAHDAHRSLSPAAQAFAQCLLTLDGSQTE